MMTVPVFGHADFQSDLPWRSNNLFPSYNPTYPVGVTSTGIIPTIGWSSLRLRCTVLFGAGRVTVAWFADAAGAQGVGTDTWPVNPNTGLSVVIPVEGAFLQLSFNNTTGGNDGVINYAVLAQADSNVLSYPISASSAFGNSVSIPASSVFTAFPAFYAKGHGRLRLSPGDALGKLNASLENHDEVGTVLGILDQENGFTGAVQYDFPYPDTLLRLVVTNTDAGAAHVLTYHLWCDDD